MSRCPRRGPAIGTAVAALVLVACPYDPPILDDETTGGDDPPASTGLPTTTTGASTGEACAQLVCQDGAAIACDAGVPGEPIACDELCLDGLGCVACEPGATRCGDLGVERCDDAGAWQLEQACNPAQGFACDPDLWTCTGPCEPAALAGGGHLGCEFYAVSLARSIYENEVFGVFVTNPGDEPATVVAEKLLWSGTTTVVPPHATVEIFLPWTNQFHDLMPASVLVDEGAVHLQSDRPVAIVQHSPMIPNASVDASLLLPVHVWGSAYRVASAPSIVLGDLYAGVYSVVAAVDGTTVELSARPGVLALPGDGVAADGTGVLVLDRGDVLQVAVDEGSDLTGAGVTADGPILVFGGHRCAQVPSDALGCDHLEEVMLPTAQLGLRHAVVPPVTMGDPTLRREQVVRVVATADLTGLSFDPPQDLPPMLVFAGDWIEFGPDAAPFVVESTAPVLVAQYMVSRGWDSAYESDPSLTIATPVERFRDRHTVHASPYWSITDVDVVAPDGAGVTVDGAPLTDWTPIGASGLAFAHVRLMPDGENFKTIAADQPVGVSVYAPGIDWIASGASYWHPAGYQLAE